VSGQLHAPAALPPGKEPARGTHWIGGWVGPIAGQDYMENWKFLTQTRPELRLLFRWASSQSLYRSSYRGSHHCGDNKIQALPLMRAQGKPEDVTASGLCSVATFTGTALEPRYYVLGKLTQN
jgi:hypothetical protein